MTPLVCVEPHEHTSAQLLLSGWCFHMEVTFQLGFGVEMSSLWGWADRERGFLAERSDLRS